MTNNSVQSISIDGSKKESADAQFYNNYYTQLQNEPTRFGFIAQEVNEIYPELIHEDSSGNMYVDYLGMIPILVNAINELNNEIEILKDGKKESVLMFNEINSSDVNSSIVATSKLYQNAPNPFSVVTIIKFELQETIKEANLYIYNLQGKQINKFEISERGEGSVSIEGSQLDAGMYIYALIADGVEIDSKRMILTK